MVAGIGQGEFLARSTRYFHGRIRALLYPIFYPSVQLLADILVIASQWRQYQTRLEGEKYLTVSTLDIIVDGGFSVLSEASTNPALCKEVRIAFRILFLGVFGVSCGMKSLEKKRLEKRKTDESSGRSYGLDNIYDRRYVF